MRMLTENHNEEVRAHLLAEFGELDECCGVMAPPLFSTFTVDYPLQTAERDGNHCIPPGTYFVKEALQGHIGSHSMWLKGKEADREMYISVGYAGDPPREHPLSGDTRGGNCIDWRGIKKCEDMK